ncbi:hypothetical protein [Bernardetia sp.]|uniref:hypothetical protein n=1 Tax=Bernardetia sp. TaxID=1937974 RepID=UPI0025C13D2F|nr:hypothetical protein [Bernardetia sp.]
MKLFTDSTFIEEITEIEDSYQYLGTWTGSLKEGDTFKTITTKKGSQILNLTPKHKYRIVNGQPLEIETLRESQKSVSFQSISSNYSEEFQNHLQESNLILKADTILFPDSSIVLIPKYITNDQEVIFKSESGNLITIQQINYTDIEFEIQYHDQNYKGKASLSPYFYLGMETVGFSEGEYVITHYYVTETNNSCLDFIGLGNQNIAKENSENVYALVSVSDDTCKDELNELTNKKLNTITKKTYKQ